MAPANKILILAIGFALGFAATWVTTEFTQPTSLPKNVTVEGPRPVRIVGTLSI
jgi:hypothetical protein